MGTRVRSSYVCQVEGRTRGRRVRLAPNTSPLPLPVRTPSQARADMRSAVNIPPQECYLDWPGDQYRGPKAEDLW